MIVVNSYMFRLLTQHYLQIMTIKTQKYQTINEHLSTDSFFINN